MSSDPVTSILQDPRFQGQPLTWEVTPEQYDTIRHAWLTHVVAEERLFVPYTEPEWNQQMAVMLSVFTEDCTMEIVPSQERWQGKAGAKTFYRSFIPSFEGMQWVPQALVIGPQGVLDVVNMTGLLRRPFAGLTEVGEQVHLQWVIYFPWVPAEGKFRGEIIYSIRPLSAAERTTG
jgi:SnoaL-like domain